MQAERKVLFRAWIESIRSSVEPIPSLHFSNAPALENIRKRGQAEPIKHAADDLRDEHAAQAEVASAADDILASLTGDCEHRARAAA